MNFRLLGYPKYVKYSLKLKVYKVMNGYIVENMIEDEIIRRWYLFFAWSKAWWWYGIREYTEVRRQVREGMFMTVPSRFAPYYAAKYSANVAGWVFIVFGHTGVAFFWSGFLDVVTKVVPDEHFFLMVSATIVWIAIYLFEVPGMWYAPALQSLIISFLDSANVHNCSLFLWWLLVCIYGFIIYDFFRKVDSYLYIINYHQEYYVHETTINKWLAAFFQIIFGLLTLLSVLTLYLMYFLDSQVIIAELFGPILGTLLIGYLVFLPSYLMLLHAIILYKKWSFFYVIRYFVLLSVAILIIVFHYLIFVDHFFFFLDFIASYQVLPPDLDGILEFLLVNDLALFENGSLNTEVSSYFTDDEKLRLQTYIKYSYTDSLLDLVHFFKRAGYYYYLTDNPWLEHLLWLTK